MTSFLRGTNVDKRPWTSKIGGFYLFFAISGFGAHFTTLSYAEIAENRPRQPAYEIFSILVNVVGLHNFSLRYQD